MYCDLWISKFKKRIVSAETIWGNTVYLIIALKYSSTETYLVTGLSMIAEVGGMAGLLLGVSFFHTTKLIEFFINMKIEKLQGGRSGSQTET